MVEIESRFTIKLSQTDVEVAMKNNSTIPVQLPALTKNVEIVVTREKSQEVVFGANAQE